MNTDHINEEDELKLEEKGEDSFSENINEADCCLRDKELNRDVVGNKKGLLYKNQPSDKILRYISNDQLTETCEVFP
jgi:hypothetical protein